MGNKSLILLLGLAMGAGFTACSKKTDQMAAQAKTLYHCAMHPQIISDKPGECPICHMRLIAIENGGEKKILFYRNPMNPASTSPVPMKDSMGMNYIPVYADENQSGTSIPGQ